MSNAFLAPSVLDGKIGQPRIDSIAKTEGCECWEGGRRWRGEGVITLNRGIEAQERGGYFAHIYIPTSFQFS